MDSGLAASRCPRATDLYFLISKIAQRRGHPEALRTIPTLRPRPLTPSERVPMVRAEKSPRSPGVCAGIEARPMKVRNSLKSLRGRHRNNRIVRRKGRVYIINKTQRRFKARQG